MGRMSLSMSVFAEICQRWSKVPLTSETYTSTLQTNHFVASSTLMLRPRSDPHLGDVDKADYLTQGEIGRLKYNMDTIIMTLRNTPQTLVNINVYVIITSHSRNLQDFLFAFLISKTCGKHQ